MTARAGASVLDEAGRAWDAAYRLDALRGDTAASEWCARHVRRLIRAGEAEDPAKVGALADVLEARVTRACGRREGAA